MLRKGIVVTGGAGFIGSNFVLHWVGSGKGRVVNVDALTYASNLHNLDSLEGNPDHVFVHGNICDAELMAKTLAEHRPRAIRTSAFRWGWVRASSAVRILNSSAFLSRFDRIYK